MSVLQLIILALAINQAVEIWHHSPIFEHRRLLFCNYSQEPSLIPWYLQPLRWPITASICPWCVSVWIAICFMLILQNRFGEGCLTILAASRVSNLVADLQKKFRSKRNPL